MTSIKRKKKKIKKTKKRDVRNSKSRGFLKKIEKENPMLQYFSDMGLLNAAAESSSLLNPTDRKGSFVTIAHAKSEFTAPVITKGKSVSKKKKSKKRM